MSKKLKQHEVCTGILVQAFPLLYIIIIAMHNYCMSKMHRPLLPIVPKHMKVHSVQEP